MSRSLPATSVPAPTRVYDCRAFLSTAAMSLAAAEIGGLGLPALESGPREGARSAARLTGSVVGVHTPEFAFEQDRGNVRRALEQMNVGFPVALDNDYGRIVCRSRRATSTWRWGRAIATAACASACRSTTARRDLRTASMWTSVGPAPSSSSGCISRSRQPGPIVGRTLAIEFLDAGVEAFAFTFG